MLTGLVYQPALFGFAETVAVIVGAVVLPMFNVTLVEVLLPALSVVVPETV
jgi:hypothetical protein